jgi:hypothetical protein
MDFDGEDEDFSDQYGDSGYSDMEQYDSEDGGWSAYELGNMQKRIKVGIARVPLSILHATAAILHRHEAGTTSSIMLDRLQRAWMLAIAQVFPGTPLSKLRSTDPALIPCWLVERFDDYQVHIDVLLLLFKVDIVQAGAYAHHRSYCLQDETLKFQWEMRPVNGQPLTCNHQIVRLRTLERAMQNGSRESHVYIGQCFVTDVVPFDTVLLDH